MNIFLQETTQPERMKLKPSSGVVDLRLFKSYHIPRNQRVEFIVNPRLLRQTTGQPQ